MNVSLAATDLTKHIAWGPIVVNKVWGRNDSGADLYLQLYQAPVVLASAVPDPKGVLTCPTGQWFDWFFENGLSLSELCIGVSTTALTYTAPGAGLGVTGTINFASDFDVASFPGLTIVGDLTSNVASRQVWADSAGPKRLLALAIKNNNAGTTYPYISAADSPAAKNRAQLNLQGITTGATKFYSFGKDGYKPFEQQQSGTSILDRDGCNIVFSISGDYATTSIDATADKNIRAVYAN